MLSERRMKTATKKYNDLMWDMCLEHLTIGTRLSEDTDGWNIRDMVSEAQYQLDLYFECGTCAYDELHHETWGDDDRNNDVKKQAKENVKKLRKFINTYKDYVEDVVCVERHCSKWDN